MGIDNYLYRPLDSVGNGTGLMNQAVDGSGTHKKFLIKPGLKETYRLKRMNISAVGGSWAKGDEYAGIVLSKGIKIYIENDDGVMFDYTKDVTITSWPIWGLLAGSDVPTANGTGKDTLVVRWTFAKGTGKDIVLRGNYGERMVIEIQDDLSPLVYQYAMVQGLK